MYGMYLNPTHRVANKLVSLSLSNNLYRLLSTSMKMAMAETTMLTINYLLQSIKLNVLTSETRRKNSD